MCSYVLLVFFPVKVSGRHRGDAGLASQRDLQVPVEVRVSAGHVGAAGRQHDSHVHTAADVHGLEPGDGTQHLNKFKITIVISLIRIFCFVSEGREMRKTCPMNSTM